MFRGDFNPISRRPSLREMEESLSILKRWRSEFEKKLDENEGMLDENDPVQNEMYAFALYHLWTAFSESMQASGPDFGLESEFDSYAFDEATKYEREACDRFGL